MRVLATLRHQRIMWASPRVNAVADASRSLAFFRIGTALVALGHLFAVRNFLIQLYGDGGMLQWSISQLALSSWLPSVSMFTDRMTALGLSSDQCLYSFVGLYAAALVGLLLGWQTRFMAVAAWVGQLTLTNCGLFSQYGADVMLHLCLFHCVWMPIADYYSVDSGWLGKSATVPWFTKLAMTTLRLHLCLIYLNTGLAKAAGDQWWNGEAIWRALMQPQLAQIDASWLAQYPWLATLIGWITLLIEVGYGFLIWPSRIRPYWVVATVGLHAGIGLFLGLGLFAMVMMVLTMAAFGFPYLHAYVSRDSRLRLRERLVAVRPPLH